MLSKWKCPTACGNLDGNADRVTGGFHFGVLIMKWEISGADRTTGKETKLILDADDEASATRRGNRRGVLVESARPLDAGDSVAGGGGPNDRAVQVVDYSTPQVARRAAPQPPPQPVMMIPVPVATPKGLNKIELVGSAASVLGVILLCIGGKQTGDPDNPPGGGGLMAIGLILLLVGLLLFGVGRAVGHR